MTEAGPQFWQVLGTLARDLDRIRASLADLSCKHKEASSCTMDALIADNADLSLRTDVEAAPF